MTELTLFDPLSFEDPELAAIRDEKSRGRKRTLRNRWLIHRKRVHPATGYPIRPGRFRCGDCRFLSTHDSRTRSFFKCKLGRVSSGEATDIRLRWPACKLFLPSDRTQRELESGFRAGVQTVKVKGGVL